MDTRTLCLALCLLAAGAAADETPQSPQAGPTERKSPKFETDKAGRRLQMDFSLSARPISDAEMKLSHFSRRKLLIFFFSAKCPHCQYAFPHVQKLSSELENSGVATIAIAVKNNSPEDVRGFIREYRVHLPVFHDHERLFGENYGVGTIPLLMMVNEKGEYVRYPDFHPEQTLALIRSDLSSLVARK